jgi:hypothetical protein
MLGLLVSDFDAGRRHFQPFRAVAGRPVVADDAQHR